MRDRVILVIALLTALAGLAALAFVSENNSMDAVSGTVSSINLNSKTGSLVIVLEHKSTVIMDLNSDECKYYKKMIKKGDKITVLYSFMDNKKIFADRIIITRNRQLH